MKMSLPVLIVPLVILFGGALPVSSSAAVTHPYAAELAAAARRQGTVSVAGVTWSCKGNRCASSSTSTRPTVDACHSLALQVGPVRSFGRKGLLLTRDELRECNAGIPAAETSDADRRARSVTPADFAPVAGQLPGEAHAVQVTPHSAPAGTVDRSTKLPPPARPVPTGAGTPASPTRSP